MPRTLKRMLLVLGAAAGLAALAALAVSWLVPFDRYKPRLEAAASAALGMDVRVAGRLGAGFLPGLHLTLADGRILDGSGAVVASAKRTRLWIRLLPLLRGELRLGRIELTQPRLSIERDAAGRYNVEGLKKTAGLLAALDGARLSLADGSVHFADRRSGESIEAAGIDLRVSRLGLAGGRGEPRWQGLSIGAEIACRELRTKSFVVSALRATATGKAGIFALEPIALQVFGARAQGSLRVDLSGPVPLCRLTCSLPRLRVEEFLATLSPEKGAEGAMDFSATLAMRGRTPDELIRTAAGTVTVRGRDIALLRTDLDGALSRFKSSQGFNLVDAGAVLFAGPIGLAVTKGFNFANLLRGSGGHSEVRLLVSDWTVERGVARARDVALATSRNRLALQGGLDFVHGTFAGVTVAVVDEKGCATVRQAVRGPFAKPVVEKPHVLPSLAGPVLGLLRQSRRIFPAGPCEPFYSGSVPPPQ
jgi:AsmA protein